jgi:hypothetical protein
MKEVAGYKLHGVIFQEINIFITTSARTSIVGPILPHPSSHEARAQSYRFAQQRPIVQKPWHMTYNMNHIKVYNFHLKQISILWIFSRQGKIKDLRLWDITPYSPLEVNRHFRRTCRLRLYGRRKCQARNQRQDGTLPWGT